MKANRIAITYKGDDYLRIIPKKQADGNYQIKFSLLTNSFVLKKFVKDDGTSTVRLHEEFFTANKELTYHSALGEKSPIIHAKFPGEQRQYETVFDEVVSLDLRGLILPVPLCRITINNSSSRSYKPSAEHLQIDLNEEYNSVELYIASSKWQYPELEQRWPMLSLLFMISSIDSLIYGTGLAAEPIMNKMTESNSPVSALDSREISEFQIFYRTCRIPLENKLKVFSKSEYLEHDLLEFFNNIHYLDLLATTTVAKKKTNKNTVECSKPAYLYDIENLTRIGYHKDYIRKWKQRFGRMNDEFKREGFIRSGIIIPID